MESILHERINTYNQQNFLKFVMERKSVVWYGLETQLPVSSSLVSFTNAQRNETFKSIKKKR